jgi:hypothetical protein
MDNALVALFVGIMVAIVFGFFVARRSTRHDKIYGGTFARVFHFIGAAGVTGILPVVLITLILGGGFRTAFPIAMSFLAVSWLGLLAYAIVERPARAKLKQQDQGWTEQDARASY